MGRHESIGSVVTTSETILNQMIAAGWVFEENASNRVLARVPE
jgi:hypothetical protein